MAQAKTEKERNMSEPWYFYLKQRINQELWEKACSKILSLSPIPIKKDYDLILKDTRMEDTRLDEKGLWSYLGGEYFKDSDFSNWGLLCDLAFNGTVNSGKVEKEFPFLSTEDRKIWFKASDALIQSFGPYMDEPPTIE